MIAQTQIGVSIHDTTVVAGKTALIPVYVDSSLTGQNVTSFNFEFSFDDYYGTIDSVVTAGTMTDGWGTVVYNANVKGRFSVAGASTSALAGTGVLFYLRLQTNRGGSFRLRFASNNYFNEGTPGVVLNDGYIGISNPPSIDIYPDYGVIAVGDTKDFNVSGGTSPYSWSVSNPAVASIDINGTVTALSKGTTKVICEDNTGIVDTITGVVEVRAFKLTTRDTAFYQGNIVDIPVYTSDLTGFNYTAGQIVISVDANDLTPLSIETTGTLLQSYPSPQFSFANNKLTIAFAGDTPLAGSGILFYIRFQISAVNTGGTHLTFQNILFNETDLGLGVNSYFDIIPLPTITISPNTAKLVAGQTQTFTPSGGTPPYTWSVSNSTLASIDTSGTLLAIKGGVVTVHITDVHGGSGSTDNIYLYDTQVSLPQTTMAKGDTVDVPLQMGNLNSSYSVVSVQGEIGFDSSKVRFVGIETSGTSTNGWSFSTNNTGNKVVFAGAGVTGFNASGTIVKFRFISTPTAVNGNYSTLTLNNFMFNEGSPNALTTNGKITISDTAPPGAPTGLSATAQTDHEILLSWSDNSGNETGFKIERTQDTTSSWSPVGTVSANTTDFTDTGLIDGTQYYYRVYAYNSNGNSFYSNIAGAFTFLSAPTNLTGTAGVVSTTLNLTWTDNSQAESGYVLERKTYTSSFSVLATLGANVTSYTDSNLTVGEEYTYRVKAFNALTNSEYSNTFLYFVSNPAPNPPSGLVATAKDTAAIGLLWNDNSANEDGFAIERKDSYGGSWNLIDSLAANSTDYTDNGLLDGMLYYYRVNAFNTNGSSPYSNIDSAVTVMIPPRNLSASNPEPGKVVLTWTETSQTENGFIIERAEGTIGSSLLFTVIDTVGTDQTTYTDSNLTSSVSYVYQIKGFNQYTESAYSNEAQVTLSGNEENGKIPTRYEVFQNYPNPFSKSGNNTPTTRISFNLPEQSNVKIKIYNLLGKEVRNLKSGVLEAGSHRVTWNALGLPSGIYLIYCSFESAKTHRVHTFTKKAILIK